MMQTWETVEKTNFAPNFGSQKFFSWVLPLLVEGHCFYAIYRKTNEPSLRKWRKTFFDAVFTMFWWDLFWRSSRFWELEDPVKIKSIIIVVFGIKNTKKLTKCQKKGIIYQTEYIKSEVYTFLIITPISSSGLGESKREGSKLYGDCVLYFQK